MTLKIQDMTTTKIMIKNCEPIMSTFKMGEGLIKIITCLTNFF